MAKMRAGIDLPIIPEDFISFEDDLDLDVLESYLQWTYRCIQDGADPASWSVAEVNFDQHPKN